MYQYFWIVSLIYPAGLLSAVYFSAIFLGLTIWREKVQRPRALGWSAITLLISLLAILLVVPLQFLNQVLSASYSYSSLSNDLLAIALIGGGLVFFLSLIASLILFVVAIVPANLRKRPRPKLTRDPEKNPWDD